MNLNSVISQTSSNKFIYNYLQSRIWVGTWNVNGKSPNIPINPWLKLESKPDIFVFNFQEIDISTQAHLLYTDQTKKSDWLQAIKKALPPSEYTEIISKQLVGMYIVVFSAITTQTPIKITQVTTDQVATGVMGVLGNKGGVAIRMRINDSYFVFINSHLAADKSQIEKRNQDYGEICRRTEFTIGKYETYNEYSLRNPWVCTQNDTRFGAVSDTDTVNASKGVLKNTCGIFDSEYNIKLFDIMKVI